MSSFPVLRCSQIFSRCSQDVLRMFTGCFNLKDTLVDPLGMVGLVGLVGLVLGGGGGAICLMYQQSAIRHGGRVKIACKKKVLITNTVKQLNCVLPYGG